MMYGLEDIDIQKIKAVFAGYPQINEVIIYGSRAMGNFRPASDIDFTLKGNALDLDILFKIERELDDLLLPYKLDISIFENISNSDLIDHINRVGESFYNKE